MITQWEESIWRLFLRFIQKIRGVRNAEMTADARIASVSADGKIVSAYINGADIVDAEAEPTPGILNPHDFTLAVGDEVVLFNRSEQDRIVFYPKTVRG